MYKNSFWLILLFVVCSVTVQSQNPFDIKGRKSKIYTPPERVVPVQIRDEVTKSRDTIVPPIVETAAPVEAAPISPTSATSVVSGSDNPFNVSHIPIRKRTIETRLMTKEDLKVEKSNFISRNIPLIIIFICLMLTALVVKFRDNAIKNAIRSSYNSNFLKLIKAESLHGLSRSYILLYVVFALNAALTLNHILYKGHNQFGKFGFILAVVVGIYLTKHLFLICLGKIFNLIEKQASDYSFAVQIGNIVLGLVLLPLNVLMIYGISSTAGLLATFVIGIFSIAYLFRLIRGILMSSSLLISNRFHFFLYLCACEIGPFLILLKILNRVA